MKLLPCIPLLCITLSLQAAGLPPGVMVMDGLPAPALRLDNIDGESWDISSRRGHWLFVHFWASWCGPCRREMPTIQKLMETLQDDRLEIVMVNTAETEDEVFSFLGIVAPDVVPLMDTDGSRAACRPPSWSTPRAESVTWHLVGVTGAPCPTWNSCAASLRRSLHSNSILLVAIQG
jgi:thiol-disulfide isomerase/thioredoxin